MQNLLDNKILLNRKQAREIDVRGDFFRDTTAIIHSYPFRRMKDKTQVFFAPKNDHICTRIEHVLHVSSIAAAICKGLNLNSELAWAIGLGHDLGHTPFGHVGETILNELNRENGGFIHELYSLRVVDVLAGYGKGLNLTYAVRDGIISHCGEKFEQFIIPDQEEKVLENYTDRVHLPSTWEGSVVRTADKIAYLGRDIEDAVQLKLIDHNDLPDIAANRLGTANGEIINTLVQDVIHTSKKTEKIGFSDKIYEAVKILKEFNYTRIYSSPLLTGYHSYFQRVLETLFSYLKEIFRTYHFDKEAYKKEKNILAARFGDYAEKMESYYAQDSSKSEWIIVDYIAGMTDNYALDSVNEILIPKHMHEQFDKLILE